MYPRVDIITYTLFTSDHLESYIAKVNKLFKKIRMLNDHRAIVIVSALFIEKAIDDYLESIIPDYHKLDKNRDWTFSIKIDLANSFKLCPEKLFNYSHKIRQIRNEFAHNIEIISISDLDKKYLDSLISIYKNNIYKYIIDNGEQIKDMDPIEIYLSIIEFLIINIRMRSQGNRCWNSYIRTKQFKNNLRKYIGTLDPNSSIFLNI